MKCQRCLEERDVRPFYPNLNQQQETDIIRICDTCSAKDSSVVLVKGNVSVPKINPAIPEVPTTQLPSAGIPTNQFPQPKIHGPKTTQLPTPKSVEKPQPPRPSDEQILAVHQKALSDLLESQKRIRTELIKVNKTISDQNLTDIFERAKRLPIQLGNLDQMVLARRAAIAGILQIRPDLKK